MEDADIHGYGTKLSVMLRAVERAGFSKRDRELIVSFANALLSAGLSTGRVAKYVAHMKVLREHMRCDFEKATKAEVEELMRWLNSADYTPHTRMDFKGALKRFLPLAPDGQREARRPIPGARLVDKGEHEAQRNEGA
ncbi:MAG: hypothetical protein QXX17_03905 [Conexivisphaerales archaeon]